MLYVERLQGIVEDVQQALAEREYKHALRIADSIEYQRYNTETERQWAIQREYWIDKVLTEAEENGIELEYNPMSDDDDESRERGEENVTGDFNDGVRDGLESGLDEVKDHVDEFVAIMDGETEN